MIKLTADMHTPAQENFLGLGAVYHGFAGQPDDAGRVYTPEQIALEVSRVRDMRLKIARTYYNWYPWDSKTGEWNWENDRCRAFYNWCSEMQKAGVTLAINVGWSNVGELQGDHWQGFCPLKVEGDWDATVRNYAKWVSDTFYQLVIKRGFTNVKYFLLFTEPNERSYPSLPYEGADYRELWLQCARAAHEQLKKDGYRDKIKLLGPQEGLSFHPWLNEWVWNEKHCDEFLDGGSMHNYLLFHEVGKEDIRSGDKSLLIPHGYSQIQQQITLRPNTNYTASIWLKSKISAETKEGSRILFGLFGKGSLYHYFMNYCEPQDAVFTKEIPADALSSDEWRRFEFSFNSGEHTTLNACVYSLINRADGKVDRMWFFEGGLAHLYADGTAVLCDDFSLVDSEGNELIRDSSFESATEWYTYRCKALCHDSYITWRDYESDAIKILPEKLKTEYWHDEYNSHAGSFNTALRDREHGVLLSLGQVALMNGGGKCSFLWALFDQQWPNDHRTTGDAFVDGEHRWGLMPSLFRSKTPYHAYYFWCLVSRYTGGEGTKTYEGKNLSGGKVQMNVNELPDGNYTITVVNYGRKEEDISICLNKVLGRTFYRHLADSATVTPDENATLAGVDKTFPDVRDTIEDTLPPMSVAVYTTIED
ncbi:MAG: hypothetical protein IJ426_05005 [Clostridia bacterium]|nr:hypothetical protein [Clostridia bacterium]